MFAKFNIVDFLNHVHGDQRLKSFLAALVPFLLSDGENDSLPIDRQ